MSTFDGLIEEFPDIRIDYFRTHPNKKPPAACFLSHVHSDHLLGLETLKMPFVYCSAATRRLLLKMEKYPHRINFSKGILEARKQTYKHLKTILRPVPLQTPFELELGPRHSIRVTLFDANHCPGAVMFLIEGHERAVLYTGDVRAEPWWVNSLVRNPILIPYACGQKQLDCLYLDTTFASHRDIHREFPTKAEGLAELLQKLSDCPADSVFYFRAWTLGYEDVWIAMSSFLHSRIHVDRYQLQLFRAMAEEGHPSDSGLALAGFRVGNNDQAGYLTTDSDVNIHSCEPSMPCHASISKNKNTVWITPIISRTSDGTEIAEIGAGGGKGDLYQCRELDVGNDAMFEALKVLISTLAENEDAANRLDELLQSARNHQDHRMIFDSLGPDPDSELSLKDFVELILNEQGTSAPSTNPRASKVNQQTTNTVHFPYSRHSSYSELCDLVQRFRPKDICPCTVDLVSWSEEVSMSSLFGKFCSDSSFKYDQVVREEVEERRKNSAPSNDEPMSQDQETQQIETQTASQASVDDFRSFEEHLTQQHISIEDESVPQIPLSEQDLLHKFRNDWRIENGGTSKYERKAVDSRSLLTSGIDIIAEVAVVHQQRSKDDLSDPNGSSIIHKKRVRIDGKGTVSDVNGTDGSGVSRSSDNETAIDFERRTMAFDAARICLETGDHSHWDALNISSLSHYDHQNNSPEF